MIKEEDDGLWLVLEETIASHHEDVFACLTTEGGLTQWYPVAAEVDLRTGGQIRFCWDKDCKRTLTVAILNFDPGGKIVWDWYADHSEMHAPIYWEVEPNVEKGSQVVFRQGPFRDNRDALIAMAKEAAAWRWNLCNLRSVLETRHDMRKHRPL